MSWLLEYGVRNDPIPTESHQQLTSSSRVYITSSLGYQREWKWNIFDNDDHMVPIMYSLKDGFRAYFPNLELNNSGKMCYNLDGIDNFTRQGHYEYGATLFDTYMICASLCFLDQSAMIHQALQLMESKSTMHRTQNTL